MKEAREYLKELENFIQNSSAGEMIFEKKPNGDILISKRETRLIKIDNKVMHSGEAACFSQYD